MKKRYFILLILLLNQVSYGQADIINSPFLVSSAGDTWTQENYNLCFSLGEIAIETHVQSDIILTQGFHQENNYQITALNTELDNYQITIYPNPTSDILNFKGDLKSVVAINLKDSKGSFISSFNNTILDETYSIDVSQIASGIYFLEILLSQNKNQVYQIQKYN